MGEKERPREERTKLRAHCLTALRMRGGSHLAQNHVGQARKDARYSVFAQLSVLLFEAICMRVVPYIDFVSCDIVPHSARSCRGPKPSYLLDLLRSTPPRVRMSLRIPLLHGIDVRRLDCVSDPLSTRINVFVSHIQEHDTISRG